MENNITNHLNKAEEYLANAKEELQKIQDDTINDTNIKKRFEELSLAEELLLKSIRNERNNLLKKLMELFFLLVKNLPDKQRLFMFGFENLGYGVNYVEIDRNYRNQRMLMYCRTGRSGSEYDSYHGEMSFEKIINNEQLVKSLTSSLQRNIEEKLKEYPANMENLKDIKTKLISSLEKFETLAKNISIVQVL